MLTDADLEPILRAVPSYGSEWAEERGSGLAAGANPEPGLAYWFFSGLAYHLADRAAVGDFTEFPPMFAALDRLYREAPEAADIHTVLSSGFLESLIHSVEQHGMDASVLTPHVTGADACSNWDAAYAYVHGESAS